MSRKNRNKNSRRNVNTAIAAPSPVRPTPKSPASTDTTIQEIVEQAITKLDDSMIPEAEHAQPPVSVDGKVNDAQLREAWQQLKEAEANYLSGRQRLDGLLESAQKDKEQLSADRQEVDSELKRLDSLRRELDGRETTLLDEAEELARQRADAEAGFLKSRRESLSKLDETVDELLQNVAEQMGTLVARRQELVDDATKEREAALVVERDNLEAAKRELAKASRQAQWDAEDFEEQVSNAQKRAAAEAAGKVEALEIKCEDLEARLQSARDERNRLSQQLESQQRILADFGDRSPEVLHSDLQRYQETIRDMEQKLATAPSQHLVEDYKRLKNAHEAQVDTLLEQEQRLAEEREQLNRARIAVTELESIRDERRVLEQHKRLLGAKILDLESRLEEFIEGEAGRTPFPSCRAMDEDRRRQQVPALRSQLPDLKTFVTDLRLRIAWQSSQKGTTRTLFYSEPDLRSFVAGMAMSEFHILQGISGTGKTSLPLAIAKAIGAGSHLVAVQAGWRDRQDLLGHYNTFEKRYYETDFLQALYEAQTAQYRDRVYVIVLDEMNLSHPEQYFADLLSELERPEPRDRHLDLMTAPVAAAPQGLAEGRRLQIPHNVWFVGTANHDETTKDFADKTYDRAHVMELPRHREEFKAEALPELEPLTSSALRDAFERAQEKYSKVAREAYKFIDNGFTDLLGERFGLSWGNRLERQATLYIPVVVAAGGSPAEAVDHLFATKILRKLRNRHDIRPEYLQELRQALVEKSKSKSGMLKGNLSRSVGLVADELRRLGMVED